MQLKMVPNYFSLKLKSGRNFVAARPCILVETFWTNLYETPEEVIELYHAHVWWIRLHDHDPNLFCVKLIIFQVKIKTIPENDSMILF